ncbi:mycofactocin biosynthesis chaperone MftB [Streptomyces sp. JW3]|uniref:mycofactocin biosynthesis chaperone MftB n=1 Tax=Streptomyces sp. JW3 TaxID=3456955 RepID=UPI003FA49A3F
MSDPMLEESGTMSWPRFDEAWQLSPSVALRPEPFGALAYHFGNRKLTFLKRPELVAAVRALATHPDVRSALVAAGIAPGEHDAYLAALRGLAEADMIRPRHHDPAPSPR